MRRYTLESTAKKLNKPCLKNRLLLHGIDSYSFLISKNMGLNFSNWICSKSRKNMFVKIVHPGGHVELHDRPILASEIIYRNPRCVVAHPHVFQQPWAIVKPETELMLGQKFYVVPVTTIRKLQRVSKKQSRSSATNSPVCQTPTTSKSQKSEELQDPHDSDDDSSICWFFTKKKNNNTPNTCINHLDGESASANTSTASSTAGKGVMEKEEGSSCFSDKNCFKCMRKGVESCRDKADHGDDCGEKTGHAKGSPKRHPEFDQWQRSLASITETDQE